MRLVIIGGDAAGMSAASEARRRAPDAEIVVLEATRDVSYGACGLPYKLVEGADVEDLNIISAERFRSERKLDVRLGHRVEALDTSSKTVRGRCDDGPFELTYDKLLIATGAAAMRPPIQGFDALWGDGAYTLKTLQDGRDLKAALAKKPRRAVVVGGGYIGLEATENLRERGLEVTVVEALPSLVPFLPEAMRERVMAEAKAHGVDVRLGARVTSATRSATGDIVVSTTEGDVMTDVVLVAVGVRPNVGFAKEAGLALGAGGSIAVDDALRTSALDVYAAGDCADAEHGVTGKSVWIPLALRANRAGKVAGQNMTGGRGVVPGVLGTAVFKFFGLEVARVGLSEDEAREAGFDVAVAEITGSTRAHYYPGGGKLSVSLVGDRKTGKLLGGCMVGPEGAAHRIDTVAAALHAGMTADDVYAMDLAYAPPFGPSWSPLLIAASALGKAMKKR